MIRDIDEHQDHFGVEAICRALRPAVRGFLTSRGYCAVKTRAPSARRFRDELLVPEVARLHAENYGVYGRRKMHALLRRQGWAVGRNQNERLMRLAGVGGVKRSKQAFTTKPDAALAKPRDLVQRRFTAEGPRRHARGIRNSAAGFPPAGQALEPPVRPRIGWCRCRTRRPRRRSHSIPRSGGARTGSAWRSPRSRSSISPR
ncbi:IS3 family transposase [Agromyces sp. NPDC049794]|uniref:IS3 family transposase n=1 Tax=unclassified Agromyces TaxID=2639701 RepID=UPI0033C4C81C